MTKRTLFIGLTGATLLLLTWFLSSLDKFWILNNPYPARESYQKVYYSSFAEQPKTLDPARSYSSNEYQFIGQIYEPLLHYDYFVRPYKLQPLTAVALPLVHYLDKDKKPVLEGSEKVAYSVYTIYIKPGIFYQKHPAFARDAKQQPLYWNISPAYLEKENISELSDFKHTATRELKADDYIYQIKRLASPFVSSPIYGLMSNVILGFQEFADLLPKKNKAFIDLRKYPLTGVRKLGDYSFEITIKGQYPQFMFWLAMPFFSPIPWEADRFYSQAGMNEKNLNFDWYPLGTGPFFLSENNPNKRMVLTKNPEFRVEHYPLHGSFEDEKAGYLKAKGQRIPMIAKAVFALEKEAIPKWNKFLQGYYDEFAITADSYDQAVRLGPDGKPILTEAIRAKKMHLVKNTELAFYYIGFNMLDPIVGGHSARAEKLRRAISIAIDMEEFINIFQNGRGSAAQGPIPPGIVGFKPGEAGMNPYVYRWQNQKIERRPLKEARELMKEAGYPSGRDPATNSALILHYDVAARGAPDEKATHDWMRKQFARLGIELDIRETQYNRFQEKLRSGNAQIYKWGWLADYPDPENFLFLFYSRHGKAAYGGENASNYANPAFDKLFDAMKNLPNGEARQQLIDRALNILRKDAPMVWGVHTENLLLTQAWVSLVKPNPLNMSRLKYIDLDLNLRNQLRGEWNHPVLWPLGLFLFLCLLMGLIFYLAYRQKDSRTARRMSR